MRLVAKLAAILRAIAIRPGRHVGVQGGPGAGTAGYDKFNPAATITQNMAYLSS
jgi:hypothetical protein